MVKIQIVDVERTCCSWQDLQLLKLNGIRIGDIFSGRIDKSCGAVHFIYKMKHCVAWLNISCKLVN